MKFGIGFATSGAFSNPSLLGHLAITAERCGFESLWSVEHVAIPVKHLPYPGSKDGQMPGGDDVAIPDRSTLSPTLRQLRKQSDSGPAY
jgi:alkanesulfonate monooxygenase SsuD/methylene tetrahydromethanopterin reductase-like flavin-dependent oxidoreductase (luciferase family)